MSMRVRGVVAVRGEDPHDDALEPVWVLLAVVVLVTKVVARAAHQWSASRCARVASRRTRACSSVRV